MLKIYTITVLFFSLLLRVVQISMDGPNVKIKVNLSEEFYTTLTISDSCGIQTVQDSFKAGVEATGWSVSSPLSGLYYHNR